MLLATSGHIPLSPAKVVKANTLQRRKIPTQLQPQGQKTKKFHYTEVLGDPHTVQACYPHFSHPFLGHLVPSPGLPVFFFSSIRFL